MNISTQLAKRFQEVYLNGDWVANTNFKKALSDVTWQEAVREVGSLNTIAALTFHVNYYISGVLTVLRGGSLEIKDQYSFECPEIQSPAGWEALVNDLLANSEAFAEEIEKISDIQLREIFVDEKYGTYQRNIEGIIEHGYYHLGQIVLLKKLIRNKNKP